MLSSRIKYSYVTQIEAELLLLICEVPNIQFTVEVMEMACMAWSWIMTSKPELCPKILSHIIRSWYIVANNQHGLYDTSNQ
jgi:hypothetical protein